MVSAHLTQRIATALAASLLAALAAGGVWLAAPYGHAPVPPGDQGDRRAVAAPAPAATPARDVPVVQPPAGATVAEAQCAPLLPRLPGVSPAQCAAALLAPSGAVSVQGRPIVWRDVAPARGVAPRRVLVVGAIHGDELTSATLALQWVGAAEAELGERPVHWRFIPVLNPDGLLARPATRVNAQGVDLNRNFPTPDWDRDAPVYWEQRTRRDPRRWPGPTPLSEPESRFLHQQIEQFRPQLVVSIHAPYGVLDFDGPQRPPERLGHLWLDKVGVFPGSLGHYSGLHLGVPVVTIELHHALRMPPDAEISTMWRDLLRWMDEHLPVAAQREESQ